MAIHKFNPKSWNTPFVKIPDGGGSQFRRKKNYMKGTVRNKWFYVQRLTQLTTHNTNIITTNKQKSKK